MGISFKVKPADLDFIETARHGFTNEARISAPPDVVFRAFDEMEQWFPDFRSLKWTSPVPHGSGSSRVLRLKSISLHERILAWVPGERFAFTAERMSAPLVRRFVEDISFAETTSGDTMVTWLVRYEPTWLMRALHPVIRKVLGKLFRNSIEALKKHAETHPNARPA